MKQLILAFTLIFAPAIASAAQIINVKVDGLVCDFCAQSLEKLFDKQEQVQDITVDLTHGLVIVQVKDNHTISDEKLTTLITDSGYSISAIER